MKYDETVSKPGGGSVLLTLGYHKKENGELGFTSTYASAGFRKLFFLSQNHPLKDIFRIVQAAEPAIWREWTEYIVKTDAAVYLSNYDSVQGAVYEKKLLQFFQIRMAWKYVSISVDKIHYSVTVTMHEITGDVLPINKWNWQETALTRKLGEDISGGNYWDIDLHKEVIYLSANLAKILKIAQSGVVIPLRRFLLHIHPDDMSDVQNAIRNVGHEQITIHYRHRLPDGKCLHMTAHAIPFFDGSGNVAHIKGRVQDNTEQETAIEMLAISEKRFRSVVENTSDIFVLLDCNGLVNYVSPSVWPVLGYQPERLLGKHYVHFLGPYTNPEKSMRSFHSSVQKKGLPQHEIQLLHTDGSPRWFRVSMAPIEDRSGGTAEIGVMCRDITREKKQKDKLVFMAHHDALTHTLNRSYFEEMLERIQELDQLSCALIMLDINGLKMVNDAFGRAQGDALLAEAAFIFEEAAAVKSGIVARTGGDEFVILVECTTREEAEGICHSIAKACRNTKHRKIPLHISWGISFSHDAHKDIHEMYEKAEERMYRKKLLDSDSLHSHIISSLKTALESRHLETADHMSRMERIAVSIGKRAGLTSTELDRLVLLASLHDIGKVAIPDHIINKPGKLTVEEFEIMKTHCDVGRRIAISSQELACIADEIRYHHERWDGAGYPQGIKGEQIPTLSRMVSVADAYDVMTNSRPYKKPMTHEQALHELHRCSGTQFDPAIVTIFDQLYSSAASLPG